jgi:hypothetical protein
MNLTGIGRYQVIMVKPGKRDGIFITNESKSETKEILFSFKLIEKISEV